MSTPPGWEPRPGPTRGEPARRAPRGSGNWARDDADPRRQGGRGGAAAGGRGTGSGPSFTPGRAPGPRDGGPGGQRAPRGGQGRPAPNSDGYDRRGPRPDDFAGPSRASGEGRALDRDRRPDGQNGLDVFRSEGLTRWLGRMSTRTAMLVLAACTLLGLVLTLAAGQEPGGLLGFFVIVGTVGAALGIQRGKVYLLFPAPALAFFLAAIVTGKVHDAKLGSSAAGLGAAFTQWVAGIFFPAVVATIVVLLVGGGRWLLGRQLLTGQPLSAGRAAPGKARPAPRDRRPGVDSWAEDDPFVSPAPRPAKTGPASRQDRPAWMGSPGGSARLARPPRDPRTDRDPWGDPRLPADRSQPPTGPRPQATGPRPQATDPRPQASGPRPQATDPRPQASGQGRPAPQPRDRPARPPVNPNNPRPQRPPRPQPPDGWTKR